MDFLLSEYSIGIDIGGTNTKFGLVESTGNVIYTSKFPTESEKGFDDFVKRVTSEVNLIKNKYSKHKILELELAHQMQTQKLEILNFLQT